MNIEQLKSGSYRIRQTYKGKRYSITIDHKPTQKEAIQLMANMLDNVVNYNHMTFKQACNEYIKIKDNVLSPSTKRGYNGYINVFSNSFALMYVNNITQADVQKEINNYAKKHSAKSVYNIHGFISAVIKEFRPNFVLYTKLPQKQKKDEYIPTTEDITRILNIISDKYKLGYMLAICGLRRSELCALTPEDLETNSDILHINKSWVQDENKNWIEKKTNKTDASTRDIILPREFATLYRETTPDKNNHVYKMYPNSLLKELSRCQQALDIPHFRLHACRGYYASLLHEQGISDAVIMEMGGWESDYIMKKVYRHALTDTKNRNMQESADKINDIFGSK